jgi:hypothetical protein
MTATNLPITGASTYLAYGWEATYKTAPVAASIDKVFGIGQKISTYEFDNDAEYVYSLGSQDLQRQFAKKFNGNWSIDAIYSDPWFFRAILGAAPTDAAVTSAYSHTWDSTKITNAIPSMTIDIANDFSTTDSDHLLTGAILKSFTLTAAVGEPIRIKFDGLYSQLTKSSTLTKSSQVAPVNEPMYFQQASLQLPSGTTLAEVQSVELNWNRNIDALWGLGSRIPSNYVAKQREWSGRMTIIYKTDSDVLDGILGNAAGIDGTNGYNSTPAEIATLVLTINNGVTPGAAGSRILVITLANIFLSKGSMPISVEDVTKIDVDFRARSLTSVVATDATAVAK